MGDTFRKVEEHLLKVSAACPITPETELYRDLGIYGDDLAFDVVLWAYREFGVEPNLRMAEYAPRESMFWPFRRLTKLLGMKERQYKSLKVRDVVAAIEMKRWLE